MCGIAGIYNLRPKDKETGRQRDQEIIKKMTDTIIYRGPDDEGYFVEEKITLGHRRLSILDLSSAGHQPMFSADKNLVTVFNGEIYNYIEIRQTLIDKGYKFKSQSDTEVILAAYQEWGVSCQNKFNGMWAFVIYDRKKDLLFGSRDRFGVKPFFYFLDQEKLIFASEIKAMLAYPGLKRKPNDRIIWNYLINGSLDYTKETFFEGIKQLPGSHYFILKNNRLKIARYWQLKTNPEKLKTDEDCQEKFKNLFLDSVKLRLRSDVSVGTCLSGGLDSSAIVCTIDQILKLENNHPKQKTFSARYDSKNFSGCDEGDYIKEVIRKTKTQPAYIFPNGRDLAKDIKKIIWHHDAPVISTSIYAQWSVFRLAKKHKVKVMLDGQGSDEYLAGYFTFFPYLFSARVGQKRYGLLIREIYDFLRLHGSQAFSGFFASFNRFPLLKSLQKKSLPSLKSIYQGTYFDYSLFASGWKNKHFAVKSETFVSEPFNNFSQNLLFNNGLPALLRYEDRNSMAFSVESRTPFLDYRLVEFVYNLPIEQKIRFGQTKWVMRQALKGILPEKIRTRQDKIGFNTPEESWFKNELAIQIKKTFRSKSFAQREYFDAPKITQAFDQFLEGEPISYQLFWRIYNLELWLRQYFDKN